MKGYNMKKRFLVAILMTSAVISTSVAYASVQKDVVTSPSCIYKSEKDRVNKTIATANKQGYFQLDDYGIAWNGTLNKNETYDVYVYETDMDAEYEWYRFHFTALMNYVYFEDIATWYPSLKNKNVKLVIYKNSTYVTEAWGEMKDNRIPKESLVEPLPTNAPESSGANYIPM